MKTFNFKGKIAKDFYLQLKKKNIIGNQRARGLGGDGAYKFIGIACGSHLNLIKGRAPGQGPKDHGITI